MTEAQSVTEAPSMTEAAPMTEIAIRARRAAFNVAIANRDASAIGPILAKNCVMITGSDSSVITGRMAQVKTWRALFASDDTAMYTRLPDIITVSSAEPIAMEQGRWEGAGPEGLVLHSGDYSAKWRSIGGQWVIEAEIFVTQA